MTPHGETKVLAQFGDSSIQVLVQMFILCTDRMILIALIQNIAAVEEAYLLFQDKPICVSMMLQVLEMKIEQIMVKLMIKEDL